ncbi:ADP-glyceromanno-heptose 6-epimerase [Desulfurispirillum indicum]|uniref:ADP-L-glycero-D-manno-heptose-6-epimerase n=1 Tax=Desulfurispirillum indicum (strain ATCC BAA-1389 / DSM 22839 / S5) TaxID=653733 RepID=E6W178_DESIS|nr:ADP-glyceromanno-heptose 6-epimerase [Desulfurispirillum indicum]ADU66498.1 ADP-L-glycero-D-manno-heptose-6-epimerase [Desulfurispirillum indicum S5]UCZ55832.1 ADP-glyceromanno-heptose 6-epimerase [Desulfurispirillum indicum]
MRFMVTGGAGFIGSNLAFALKQQGHDVVVVDDFSSGHYKNLIGFTGEVVTMDMARIEELAEVESLLPLDGIFHQAAITDTTVMDQKRMMKVNNDAFRHLLEWAVEKEIPVVYASSAGVYGNSPAPNRVDQGLLPENIYGFSKYAMDMTARSFMERHPEQRIVGLRYFNVYGPGESHKGHAASMVYQLYHQILAGKRPRLFKHGEQKRDFIYVTDIVQANLRAMFSEGDVSGVYNVGTGTARTFNDMIAIICRELATENTVEYIDNPYAFYQNHTEADISATQGRLGYRPEYTFEAGIAAYLKALQSAR